MLVTQILQLIASICLIVPLCRGAITDIRLRKFPKEYWQGFAPVGGIFTVLFYLVAFANGEQIHMLIALSILSCVFFYIMAMRFGSGGDWRALIYVAAIAPWLIIYTFILSLIIAVIQSIYSLCAFHNGEPLIYRNIPWAAGICVAFIISLIYWILTVMFIS